MFVYMIRLPAVLVKLYLSIIITFLFCAAFCGVFRAWRGFPDLERFFRLGEVYSLIGSNKKPFKMFLGGSFQAARSTNNPFKGIFDGAFRPNRSTKISIVNFLVE